MGPPVAALAMAPRPAGDPASKLYNRIAVLRAERALSRKQLAESLDVNYQTIGYLERGEFSPSLELAFRIAEYFDLPIDAVFSRKPFAPLSQEMFARKEGSS